MPIKNDRCIPINSSYKFVQEPPQDLHKETPGLMLLTALKTLELELQKRHLVPSMTPGMFNPLWFAAETERNVFLWRSGCSLIQEDEFEFWVDVPRLITKRSMQLENSSPGNPFTNPFWSIASDDSRTAQEEISYLERFARVMGEIETLATALCSITARLQRLVNTGETKPRVILPAAAPQRARHQKANFNEKLGGKWYAGRGSNPRPED